MNTAAIPDAGFAAEAVADRKTSRRWRAPAGRHKIYSLPAEGACLSSSRQVPRRLSWSHKVSFHPVPNPSMPKTGQLEGKGRLCTRRARRAMPCGRPACDEVRSRRPEQSLLASIASASRGSMPEQPKPGHVNLRPALRPQRHAVSGATRHTLPSST